VANTIGFFALIKLSPSVQLAETAMDKFLLAIEGSRRYRAAKRGFEYKPVVRPQRPKPTRADAWRAFFIVSGYLLLCVTVIVAVFKLFD
jgi:hypothetical protein